MPFEDVTSIYTAQQEDAADAAKLTECLAGLSLAPQVRLVHLVDSTQTLHIGWEAAAAQASRHQHTPQKQGQDLHVFNGSSSEVYTLV